MSFYQGDQYSFILKMEVGGNPLDMEGIELIEFTIGSLSKNWPLQVTYDKDKKLFYFPVTQEETFKFDQYEHYQARIKYIDGNVYGTPVNKININERRIHNMKKITMKSINSRSGVKFTWDTPTNTIVITPQQVAKDLVSKYPNAKVSKNVMNLL